MFRYAIVRTPGDNFAEGLTNADLGKADVPRALLQHEAYCQALESCGLELVRLPPDIQYPDSTFVEDAAVLTKRSAILTRPGAASRRGEVEGLRDPLKRYYASVHEITAPGTLDGGDVCEAGSRVFIGISQRTNHEGAQQLGQWLAAEGFISTLIDIRGMNSILHLKSGIAHLSNNDLVVMEELAGREEFSEYDLIRVPAEEAYACNCVLLNGRVLIPAGFPQLQDDLLRRGYRPLPLEMSEFRKMDGGLSCLSLRF